MGKATLFGFGCAIAEGEAARSRSAQMGAAGAAVDSCVIGARSLFINYTQLSSFIALALRLPPFPESSLSLSSRLSPRNALSFLSPVLLTSPTSTGSRS